MSQTTLLLLLVALALLPTTQSIAYYAATQFITYRGTLSGTFTSSTSSRSSRSPSNCSSPSYHFTSLPNTTVQIGQNPPWDHNPFYFNIDRPGNEIPSTSSHPCYLPYGCTNDPIFNLFLESAAFACFRVEDGKPCGTIEFDDYYFVPVEILDLNLSSISAIEMEGPGKEGTGKGYAVSGNRSSFVSNGTVGGFGFDFAKPQSLKARENGCEVSDEQIRFNWNKTTPFTYALNFTNTSAAGKFWISNSNGNVSMEFHGSRADDLDSGTNPRDRGNYSAIALNASDPTRPGFMFVNGTEFVWKQYSDGAWGASSSDEGSSGVAVSVGLKKLWCVWGAFMVYYLLL